MPIKNPAHPGWIPRRRRASLKAHTGVSVRGGSWADGNLLHPRLPSTGHVLVQARGERLLRRGERRRPCGHARADQAFRGNLAGLGAGGERDTAILRGHCHALKIGIGLYRLRERNRGFLRKRTPNGSISAAAASGFTDDIIMSLALLNELMSRSKSHGAQKRRNYLEEVA